MTLASGCKVLQHGQVPSFRLLQRPGIYPRACSLSTWLLGHAARPNSQPQAAAAPWQVVTGSGLAAKLPAAGRCSALATKTGLITSVNGC